MHLNIGKNKYVKSSKLSESKFRKVLECFCLDIPAIKVAEMEGLNKNTTHLLYSKIRQRLAEMSQDEAQFSGEVEVDESYFGPRRVRGKRGRGASKKVPVVGVLKRGGKVYTKVVRRCSREELMPIIKGKVLSESTVFTDGWKSYDGLVLDGYKHYRIHHSKNEFARGKNHINGIESFWSFAKIRMVKLRGIRKDKFVLHLKESEWRWNHRNDNIYKLLLKKLRENPL
jgi:transposase